VIRSQQGQKAQPAAHDTQIFLIYLFIVINLFLLSCSDVIMSSLFDLALLRFLDNTHQETESHDVTIVLVCQNRVVQMHVDLALYLSMRRPLSATNGVQPALQLSAPTFLGQMLGSWVDVDRSIDNSSSTPSARRFQVQRCDAISAYPSHTSCGSN
jgi:hypothetical protein